jgi:hypothetical protein
MSVTCVDDTPPNTKITDKPAATVKLKQGQAKASAKFGFTATEAGSTFKCSLDGGAFKSCASPQTVKVAKGRHTFEVRATDAAGNTDQSPAAYSWTVKKA